MCTNIPIECLCSQTTPTNTPCIYTGVDLPTIGSVTGDTVESVFQDIEAYLAANIAPDISSNIVLYSEQALGTNTPGTFPVYNTLSNTSYTVPLGGDGEYEIEYVGEMFSTTTGKLNLRLLVNNSPYNPVVDREISTNGMTNVSVPFKLFASRINLIAGFTIKIEASATPSKVTTYPRNAVCKITKIS
jgi:hypothetical protein